MRRPAQMSAQLLVFPIGPTGQRSIQLPHRRIERRPVKSPIILEPASNNWVEHSGKIFDGLVTALMQVPASNLLPNRFHRLVGNGGREIDEVFPVPILRSPRPKRIAE